jgi:alpha-tubulin suppressor-like RCC1 family protein
VNRPGIVLLSALVIAAPAFGWGCGSRSVIEGLAPPLGVAPDAASSVACPTDCPAGCVSGHCLSPAVLAAGQQHTCALMEDGTVKCWGSNGANQLGRGPSTSTALPVPVSGVADAVTIAAGFDFSCAVVRSGVAICWGNDANGELGDGVDISSPGSAMSPGVPVMARGLTNAALISAGIKDTCALRLDGTVACWGYGGYGQLGDGVLGDGSSVPSVVMQLTGAQAIASGAYFNCALISDGTVQCWGAVLGTGVDKDVSIPVAVPGVQGSAALAAGNGHTCALLGDGTVACWGSNEFGELGFPTTAKCLTGLSCSLAPATVPSLGGVTALAAGNSHTCALLSDGTARCWGKNDHGQLGDGTTTQAPSPVEVSGLSGAVAIAAGYAHTCAKLTSGAFVCWGANDSGQLGDHTTRDSPVPVNVAF